MVDLKTRLILPDDRSEGTPLLATINLRSMRESIERITLSGLPEVESGLEDAPGSTDVIVSLKNGERYVASFFSYDAIEKLREKHRYTGDFLSGKYFWFNHMLLIENCTKPLVEEVVSYLLDEGDFYGLFKKL